MSLIENIDTAVRALVVEDDAYIATDIEGMLGEFGFASIDVSLTYDEARDHLNTTRYGLVVFDVLVGDKMSFGLIADALAKGCAVVTTSGYLDRSDGMENTIFVGKPVRKAGLADAIIKAQALVALETNDL